MGTTSGSGKVVEQGEGKILHVVGDKIVCKLSGADTGGAYAVIEEVTPPGS